MSPSTIALVCVHCCRRIVGDDNGGWLHEHSWDRQCDPTYASTGLDEETCA